MTTNRFLREWFCPWRIGPERQSACLNAGGAFCPKTNETTPVAPSTSVLHWKKLTLLFGVSGLHNSKRLGIVPLSPAPIVPRLVAFS